MREPKSLGNKIFESGSQKTWAIKIFERRIKKTRPIKYLKAGARFKFQFSFGNYAWETLHQPSQLRIYDRDKRD